jgi:two-component system LytT family response regulator
MNPARIVRAIVADDEPLAREGLRDLLAEVPWIEVVAETDDGASTVEAVNRIHPDVLFLDIQMPGGDGMQVVAGLSCRPHIVFTTAFDKYAVAAFEVQALDYLLKPFGPERLRQALDRLQADLQRAPNDNVAARLKALWHPDAVLSRLFVRVGGRILPIPVDKVAHFEARGDYVAMHSTEGCHVIRTRIDYLAMRLNRETFARIHRSHIVNLEAVEAFERHDEKRVRARLRGGKVIVASRAWSSELRRRAT